jgi:hypothetical protein
MPSFGKETGVRSRMAPASLCDIRDQRIGGVSQQQSSGQSWSFTYGPIDLTALEKVTTSD